MLSFLGLRSKILLGTLFLFLTLLIWVGCNETNQNIYESDQSQKPTAPLSDIRLKNTEASMANPYMQAAAKIQKPYFFKLRNRKGFVGIGLTRLDDGRIAFALLVDDASAISPNSNVYPKSIEGIPTVFEHVKGGAYIGRPAKINTSFSPQKLKKTDGNQAVFNPGESVGSIKDCYGTGTIGAFVKNAAGEFLLSCNHVLANYGNCKLGDEIYSPGLDKVNCQPIFSTKVATLYKWSDVDWGNPNKLNTMDAAIAKVPSNISTNPIPQCGNEFRPGIASPIRNPIVGTALKYCGEVSQGTYGKITAVNILIDVMAPQGKTIFSGITLCDLSSKGGDSGSLVIGKGPGNFAYQPVGLLFGGDSALKSYLIPIATVFDYFNVSLVNDDDANDKKK